MFLYAISIRQHFFAYIFYFFIQRNSIKNYRIFFSSHSIFSVLFMPRARETEKVFMADTSIRTRASNSSQLFTLIVSSPPASSFLTESYKSFLQNEWKILSSTENEGKVSFHMEISWERVETECGRCGWCVCESFSFATGKTAFQCLVPMSFSRTSNCTLHYGTQPPAVVCAAMRRGEKETWKFSSIFSLLCASGSRTFCVWGLAPNVDILHFMMSPSQQQGSKDEGLAHVASADAVMKLEFATFCTNNRSRCCRYRRLVHVIKSFLISAKCIYDNELFPLCERERERRTGSGVKWRMSEINGFWLWKAFSKHK